LSCSPRVQPSAEQYVRDKEGVSHVKGKEFAALTDGFHLVVDALKRNGLDTMYGVTGIPVTDLARLAQAKAFATSAFATSNPPAMRLR
jgi:hypothetical protein